MALRLRPLALAAAVALLLPAAAAGQVFGGVTFERGDPTHRVGVQVGGAVAVNLTSRLAVGFDGSYVAFGKTAATRYCPPPSVGPPGCVQTSGSRLMFWIGTMHLRFMEARDRSAFYGIAGVGAYVASNDATRAGVNVGGGVRLSRSVFVDLRYHQLIGAKSTRSLLPLTVGIRF
jgi:hypothetical protein